MLINFAGESFDFQRKSWGHDTTLTHESGFVLALSFTDHLMSDDGGPRYRNLSVIPQFEEAEAFVRKNTELIQRDLEKMDIAALIAEWAAERDAKEAAEVSKETSEEPPPRSSGMSDEEYYESDAYYNWKHRNR